MAGYTHTCASCDAKLKIHERYVGRTLHCTACGTEFLADPTLADVEDIIEDLVPEQRRPFPWFPVIVSVVILCAVGWWMGQAHQDGFFSEVFKPNRTAGRVAVLELEGRDRVPVSMARETVVFLVDAIEDSDPGSLEAIRAQGRLLDIAAGTKVTVIERLRKERIARVRILTGTWASRVVWAPAAALR